MRLLSKLLKNHSFSLGIIWYHKVIIRDYLHSVFMKVSYTFVYLGLSLSILLSSTNMSQAFEIGKVPCKDQSSCAPSISNAALLQSLQFKINDLKEILAQLLAQKSQVTAQTSIGSFAMTAQTVQQPKSTVTICDSSTGARAQVYELLNGRTQKHFYTTDAIEKDRFIKEFGFTDLGVVAEVASVKAVGMVALQRFKSGSSETYVLISEGSVMKVPNGFLFDKVLGYVSQKNESDSVGLRHYINVKGDHYYALADSRVDLVTKALGYTYKMDTGYVCSPKPYIAENVVLAVVGKTTVIRGSGFGENPKNPNYKVIIQDNLKERAGVSSDSSNVISWTDREIKIKTPAGIKSDYYAYITKGDILKNSNRVPVRVYAYAEYNIISKDNITGNPLPLDLAFDNDHTLWVNFEFGRGVEAFDTKTKTTKYYQDIQTPPGIFGYVDKTGNSILSTITAGEDVDVVANGDIWYTQGGSLYQQIGYGRVVQLNPTTGKQRCYSVPNGGAGLVGVVYDEKTGVVWAGIASLGATTETPNYILSFKPGTFTDTMANCAYDYKTPAPAPLCTGTTVEGCFKKHTLPSTLFDAAHLVVAPDGSVWFTSFYAHAIGKIDAKSGQIQSYPLPLSSRNEFTKGAASPWLLGAGPWQLIFGADNQLWIGEYFENNFIKFDTKRGVACTKLNSQGANPCMREYDVILFPDSSFEEEGSHTIDLDAQGNLWFVTGTFPQDGGVGYLGVIDPKGEVSLFPPLPDLGITGGGAGIVVDKKTGDIWFNEYWEKKIGHLKYLK